MMILRRIIFFLAVRGYWLRFMLNHSNSEMRHSIMIIFVLGIANQFVNPSRLNRIIHKSLNTSSGAIIWREIEKLDGGGLQIILDNLSYLRLRPEVVGPLYDLAKEKIVRV